MVEAGWRGIWTVHPGPGWGPRWLALCALAALPAEPARYASSSVHARATAPLAGLRVPIELWMDDRQLGAGTALVDGERLHVAFRNPFGQPVSVLRVDGGVVAMELVGDREIVALDAVRVVHELIGVGPADLARLALGRAPTALGPLRPEGSGWRASAGQLDVWLDREGGVRGAKSGAFTLVCGEHGLEIADGAVSWRVALGPVQRSPIPESAFDIARGDVPVVRAERLAAELAARAVTPR